MAVVWVKGPGFRLAVFLLFVYLTLCCILAVTNTALWLQISAHRPKPTSRFSSLSVVVGRNSIIYLCSVMSFTRPVTLFSPQSGSLFCDLCID